MDTKSRQIILSHTYVQDILEFEKRIRQEEERLQPNYEAIAEYKLKIIETKALLAELCY